MDSAKSNEFAYQGYKIPLPGSISADHQNHQHVTNCNNIFNCGGHNCNLCEECLTRNMYRSSPESASNSKIYNSSEVSDPDTNNTKEKEQEKDSTASETEIGEGKYFTTEKILLSILWSSIRQSELMIESAEHDNAKSDTLDTPFKGSGKTSATASDRSMMSLQDILKKNPVKKARTKVVSDPVLVRSTSKNQSKALSPSGAQPSNSTKGSSSQSTNPISDNLAEVSLKTKGNRKDKNNNTPKAVKPALKKGKISCYGKIKDHEWGCNASFDSLDELKKHWGDATTGTICLQRFIELRKK